MRYGSAVSERNYDRSGPSSDNMSSAGPMPSSAQLNREPRAGFRSAPDDRSERSPGTCIGPFKTLPFLSLTRFLAASSIYALHE